MRASLLLKTDLLARCAHIKVSINLWSFFVLCPLCEYERICLLLYFTFTLQRSDAQRRQNLFDYTFNFFAAAAADAAFVFSVYHTKRNPVVAYIKFAKLYRTLYTYFTVHPPMKPTPKTPYIKWNPCNFFYACLMIDKGTFPERVFCAT